MNADLVATTRHDFRTAALRIGLLGAGLTFFSVGLGLWAAGMTVLYPLNLGLSFLAWASGAGTTVLALVRPIDRRWSWLILASAIVFTLESVYVQAQDYTPFTVSRADNAMIAKYAVEALKHGQNPYSWNFGDFTRVYWSIGDPITPFLDGSNQNRLTYPALPTLTLLAFDTLGLGQVGIIGLIAFLFLLVLMFAGAPEPLRPLILLPLFITKPIMALALGGLQDIVWSTLLVAMILAWKRPTLRAILFGLAISYRQQPWFIAPFLLVIQWNETGDRTSRLRRIAYFAGICAGIFLLTNAPFMLWDFRGWWMGVFEPVYAAFNVYAQGSLAVLSMYGIAPLPREFYSFAQASIFLIALVIHWRHPHFIGHAFWVFPAVFFWLYYRGLSNYWFYWLPPLAVALASWHLRLNRPTVDHGQRALTTAKFAGGVVAANILLAVYFASQPSAILVTYHLPLRTDYSGQVIDQLQVTVTNFSRERYRPRFAVQHDPGTQAQPWSILSGSESLESNESGDYLISADGILGKGLPVDRDGQIVVSDADGDYSRRALTTIPGDPDLLNPDRIANPQFTRAVTGSGVPQGWQSELPTDNTLSAGVGQVGGRTALSLHIQNASETISPNVLPVRLSQRVTFPLPFSMWVYPTLKGAQLDKEVYGLEVDDGRHILWVLFGDADRHGMIGADGPAYAYVRAPLNAWSAQQVDLNQLYEMFGWSLPDYSMRDSHGLNYSARQIKLSLIAGSALNPESDWMFGSIVQGANFIAPGQFVNDALAHPDGYYTNLGDQYRAERNYPQAAEAYRTAVAYNNANPDSYFGLGESLLAQNDPKAAVAAFEKALALGYSQPALAQAEIKQAKAQISP